MSAISRANKLSSPPAKLAKAISEEFAVIPKFAAVLALILIGALWWKPVFANGLPQGTTALLVSDRVDRSFVEPLLSTVGEAAELQWSTRYLPFSRMVMVAEKGGSIVFGMSKTLEREQLFAFSDPVFSGYAWLVKLRTNNLEFHSLEDLKWHSICLFQGSSMGTEFDAAKDVLFPVVSVVGGLERGLAMLRAKRCEALVVASHLGPSALLLEARLRSDRSSESDLVVLGKPLMMSPVVFAVRKGDPLAALLPQINQSIRSHKQVIERIVAKK